MKYILCYGDSNTFGYNPKNGLRYPEEIRWTGRLGIMLGEEYKIHTYLHIREDAMTMTEPDA